ncbi:ABC transporter permease, partial [Pseudomonadota bacterium]|nr:ABC transporter permease [Pseudomonadota bacterium]
MINYEPLSTIISASGLRLILVEGYPSPWGHAVKAMMEYKGLIYRTGAQKAGEDNVELSNWSGVNSGPIVAWDSGAPLNRWNDILFLLERLSPERNLVPKDGSIAREFPRLKFGGAHLIDPEIDYWPDIWISLIYILCMGFIFWLVLLFTYYLFSYRSKPESVMSFVNLVLISSISSRVFWVALLGFCLLFAFLLVFAGHYHILGTDKVGNDVLYQSFKSIRTGVLIGTLTTLLALPFALIFGVTAGYFGGWIDDVIQFLYTTLSSIPGVLLIAAAALMLEIYMSKHADIYMSVVARADLRLLALCMIIGITSWTTLCRYVRAETLKLREMDFVAAATALGASKLRVLFRHVTPNLMHLVMITLVLDFSGLVLAEAALSYIDIGVDP